MARDIREYVLLCGCKRGKRTTSQKIVILSGKVIQPQDVLEMALMTLLEKSLTNNDFLLVPVDKAFRFAFACPLHWKSRRCSMPTIVTVFDARCAESY